MKKILIINGSPKKGGNTETLIGWVCQGAASKNIEIEVVNAAFLKYKGSGCISCRKCQKAKEYECAINDDAKPVLKKMAAADIIVMATPLYFYGPSAQLKHIFDRMFSLYKWNNKDNTMETPLTGRTFALIGSAYEDIGLDALQKPFKLTAEYSEMKFASLLVPNAGESGDIKSSKEIKAKAIAFGKKLS